MKSFTRSRIGLAPLLTKERIEAEILRRDFKKYLVAGWHTAEPTTKFLPNWHIDVVADHLARVRAGTIRRLIINVPPRTGKSLTASVFFPTWIWTDDPTARFLFASYSSRLSNKHSVDRRNVIRSRWFRARWMDRVQLRADVDTKAEFANVEGGWMFATSIGGSLTGQGGDYIILDDPHNTESAESEVERNSVISFYQNTLLTRLNNPKTGRIVLIMQRLHENDLTGHLLRNEPGVWTHLCLPMIAEKEETFGKFRRGVGDLLWPERVGPKEIAALKIGMGSWNFAGQMQQRPAPESGTIVDRAWMKFYRARPPVFDEILQSWDMSFKDSAESSFVVGQIWGRCGSLRYLLDQVRARMTFTETIRAVLALSAKWPRATVKLVEDKANGPAILDTLKARVPGMIPVTPEGSKESRLVSVSPFWEAGNVLIPDPAIAPWINDFIEEICQFPKSANDDQVDAASQALFRWRESAISTDFVAGADSAASTTDGYV